MRGGAREGAGRKKGQKSKTTREREALVAKAAKAVEDLLPEPFKGDAHAYLMTIYKDTSASPKDRMAAAIGALPYEKPKLASVEHKGDADNPLAFAVLSSVPRHDDTLNGYSNGHAANN